MLIVSQTETANKNRILKPEEIVKKVLHTLRDHHTNDVDDGPLVCYIKSLKNICFYLNLLPPASMDVPDRMHPTACKENFRRGERDSSSEKSLGPLYQTAKGYLH